MTVPEENRSHTGDLVVIGSSAGGIEALGILVSTLPSSFPAPIVVAQHLSPTHDSNLATILQRRTTMIVEEIKTIKLMQPGRIYVVPPNRHVIITDGHVALEGDHASRPRPSVDLLLTSAAKIYEERLIAVILTGSGSDGAAGGVAVKHAGGTVIIQNPATALYPSMPLALPPSIVDFEIDIEGIGPLLSNLLSGVPFEGEAKTDDVLQSILDQVSAQARLDFNRYKTPTITRRIQRRMVVVKVQTMQDYVHYLEAHPEEIGSLVSAFLINVTGFFRDEKAFDYLRDDLLPRLITQARARDGEHILRFWTAGCATGEEPYSLAILLSELLGNELPTWDIKIFATDLDEISINFARRAVYAEQLLENMPAHYQQRYFERIDSGYRVSRTLRQMVVFGQHNLTKDGPFPDIDLVVCRNVLIYFSVALQQEVLNRFAFALSSSGYLFLGKAETISPSGSLYEAVNKKHRVYHCLGRGLPKLDTTGLRRASPVVSGVVQGLKTDASINTDTSKVLELTQLRRFNEALLRFLPLGVIIINKAYHLLSANSTVRRLLGLYGVGSETEHDFLHAMHGVAYNDVRAAIDKAFRDHTVVVLPEVELTTHMGGKGRFVSFTIAVLDTTDGPQSLAAISVSEITEQVQLKQRLIAIETEQVQLMNDLREANRYVNERNQTLLTVNEALQASNEELILTQEELQASLEEFETTNEELQATNEELETTYEEAQASNEELQTMNEESSARNQELEEFGETLANEKKLLSEMVELAPFYMLVLRGAELRVRAFNPRYAQIINTEEIQGQPLMDVADLLWVNGSSVTNLIRQAYRQDLALTTHRVRMRLPEPEDGIAERDLIINIVPSHDPSGRIEGIVLYATDVTEQQIRVVEEERERLRLLFNSVPQVALALFDANTAKLVLANSRYIDALEHPRLANNAADTEQTRSRLGPFTPPEQEFALWEQVLSLRKPIALPELHYSTMLDDNESFWSGMLTPIMKTDDSERIEYVLLSTIEITDQVQARKSLEQVDKLKDTFLSVVSHELRTPMTSILGSAQVLQRNLSMYQATDAKEAVATFDFQRAERLLTTIVHQIKQMNLLVSDILEQTRIRTGQLEMNTSKRIDLVDMVRRVVAQQQEMVNSHPIDLTVDQEPLKGNFDEPRLEQVLNNLISNAVKYSAINKPIMVGIECRQIPDTDRDEAVIWVRDEGYGISEDQQMHVFNSFYRVRTQNTAHIEGVGLGLYISHQIVVRSGGRMWVESKTGVGSTFFFALPLDTPGTESE